VWSKAGMLVEGMHTVGDIITKISANCVINLHVALLFMCLFLWVIICAVITVFIFIGIPVYAACICYYYFSVNLCICCTMCTFEV
jgi:hypothetical protein